ncbi:hypothetical protein NPIL_50371 [Nephila pilipes]|uniref:Uncharacterized protein n=1 Tax=Nephila pilipes TaxID=299642 RepID=A0A8X6ML46_NEPPI|nr:hypothetical protein NPIL_50371 [Nephila pilipes]
MKFPTPFFNAPDSSSAFLDQNSYNSISERPVIAKVKLIKIHVYIRVTDSSYFHRALSVHILLVGALVHLNLPKMKLLLICLLSMTLMTLCQGWAVAVSCFRGPDGQIRCTRAIDPNGFSAAASASSITAGGQVARTPVQYGLNPERNNQYRPLPLARQSNPA